eukprot:gene15330-biopygen9237
MCGEPGELGELPGIGKLGELEGSGDPRNTGISISSQNSQNPKNSESAQNSQSAGSFLGMAPTSPRSQYSYVAEPAPHLVNLESTSWRLPGSASSPAGRRGRAGGATIRRGAQRSTTRRYGIRGRVKLAFEDA